MTQDSRIPDQPVEPMSLEAYRELVAALLCEPLDDYMQRACAYYHGAGIPCVTAAHILTKHLWERAAPQGGEG